MSRRVVLYELNEVPWHVIDFYNSVRPDSELAGLVDRSLNVTTVCRDPEPLQPWRTWPTFHNSLYTADHQSYDLGQDPGTFKGEPLWDVVDSAGKVAGIFGPMQSWPAREFRNGGFYIPDTFARSSETYPKALEGFQRFNLAMTQENTFNPEGQLSPVALAKVGLDLVRLGLSARSAASVSRHLLGEFRDSRHRASRSTMQALPSFDLYWRLHRRYAPDLSVFFTNHVAGMMHRYWGDGVPGYMSSRGYEPDPVYAGFIIKAMDIFDRHLSRMLQWLRQHPEAILIIASSMGQFAIDKEDIDETFVLDHPDLLATALGLEAEVGSAMYPRTSLLLPDEQAAADAVARLATVHTEERPLFEDMRVVGRTASFAIDQLSWGRPRTPYIRYRSSTGVVTHGSISDLGVSIRHRMGGGNTAYHVPEGILLAYGAGISPDATRRTMDVLDAAPSILEALEVPIPDSYNGTASLKLR